MHGPGKLKLKKAKEAKEKQQQEVNDPEDKIKAEDDTDTIPSWDSVTSTPRLT